MAFKGTANKSASGASMSKYDVEVEARLKALEAVAHPVPADGGGGDPRVDVIIEAAKAAKSPDVGSGAKLKMVLDAIAAL